MEIVHCSFCKHGNPADAKFCNACGSSLSLQLCEACGAIDNVSAVVCHKCGQPFAHSSQPVPADADAGQVPPSAARADQAALRARSPWKLIVPVVLIAAGTLVIYPRVAGDESAPPTIRAPESAETRAPPDLPSPASLPPADAPQATAPDMAPEAAEPAPPPDNTATGPAEELPQGPGEAAAEVEEKIPAPTDTTTASMPDEASPPATAPPPPPAQAAVAAKPETTAAVPQATPAGCSPAIDALGLCKQGFR